MSQALTWRALQRGMTLVELMVAIVIGLFITVVAIKVAVDRLTGDRAHIAEVRVNQNLRAAADVIARELRRAGYWDGALSGVFKNDGTVPVANPYVAIVWPQLTELDYAYQRDATSSALQYRFQRVVNADGIGVLQFRDAAQANSSWQDLTDPSVVNILDGFTIQVLGPTNAPVPDSTKSVAGREVELYMSCPCWKQNLCMTLGSSPTRPRLVIRQFLIRIPARSVVDSNVVRELVETVRVRNDALIGSCPASP